MIIKDGNYSVYVHINTINSKVYVGATHKIPVYKRWGLTGIGYKKNKRFYSDIEKYGWDNFEHIIFASGLNESEASHMEKLLIQEYDSTNPNKGYNFERGGLNHAEEERCKKISESTKGAKHHHYGKPVPSETRKKIGEAMKGEKGFWYGKKLSQETLDKMSAALKGRMINTEKFIKHTREVSKKIRCVETGEEYPSIATAAKTLNVNHVPISRAVNGKQATAYGMHWEFV